MMAQSRMRGQLAHRGPRSGREPTPLQDPQPSQTGKPEEESTLDSQLGVLFGQTPAAEAGAQHLTPVTHLDDDVPIGPTPLPMSTPSQPMATPVAPVPSNASDITDEEDPSE